MNRIFKALRSEMQQKHDTVLATIVASDGSTPRGTGSMMLAGAAGRITGTIGGGAVECRCEQMAKELIAQKKSLCHEFRLRRNDTEDIGMVCGGDVTVLLQYIPADSERWASVAEALLQRIADRKPGWLVLRADAEFPALADDPVPQEKNGVALPLPIGERVFIFGGGHVACALAPLLGTVGFRVTVMDERPGFATKERFPTADGLICGNYTKLSDYITFHDDDYAVVMTNGHHFDLEVQDQLLRRKLAYVGVIGSRSKKAAVNQKLRERGIPEDAIACVHSPIGTDIKAVTPEEIAVSITGELIMVRALRRENGAAETHGCPMHE